MKHQTLALAPTIEKVEGLDVEILPEVTTDPQSDAFPYVFRTADGDELESILQSDYTIKRYKQIDEYEDASLYYIRHSSDVHLISPVVTDVDGLILQAKTKDNGWIVRVQLPGRSELHSIWKYARKNDIEINFLNIQREDGFEANETHTLTEEQKEALVVAYNQGYFSQPRESSLEEIADEVGITSPAMGGRLKRGIRNLIADSLPGEVER
ncbi:helix-turn-helix domain-containing protein [Natronococcus occultus]|nr:helix-turn-helix domain-containing protein [Natronococcus occultus]